ncbi:MAG: hypothetical protein ACI9JL_004196 [Paracoccaceae bacterium]|jgi:hypothetical protein
MIGIVFRLYCVAVPAVVIAAVWSPLGIAG